MPKAIREYNAHTKERMLQKTRHLEPGIPQNGGLRSFENI